MKGGVYRMLTIEQYGKIELRLCKIVEKFFYRRFFL